MKKDKVQNRFEFFSSLKRGDVIRYPLRDGGSAYVYYIFMKIQTDVSLTSFVQMQMECLYNNDYHGGKWIFSPVVSWDMYGNTFIEKLYEDAEVDE